MKASTVSRIFGGVCLLGVVLFIAKACDVFAAGNFNEFSPVVVWLPVGKALLCGLFAVLWFAGARASQKCERSAAKRE